MQIGAEGGDILEPDVLAYRLVARESPLDRAVLHELIGRPKRYVDLKPLLGDKGDHNLTVSLKRLQDWGLIERRTDARQEPAVHAYELTPLGIQTVLAIPAIQPIHESVERFERARTQAALADLRERVHAASAARAERAAASTAPGGDVYDSVAALAGRFVTSAIDEAILRIAAQEAERAEGPAHRKGRRGDARG